ncbi:hypothetical protein BN000_00135 [Mycobacterium europaeum]|uniref:Uncharacterized protein n=1 Tax=Mycobacterium europaeum TaxID=761804 RepID=A0A0U1CUC3_9MYCO|nr:hypothetical protein BN000_00135 [Mycobacterium europaeum]
MRLMTRLVAGIANDRCVGKSTRVILYNEVKHVDEIVTSVVFFSLSAQLGQKLLRFVLCPGGPVSRDDHAPIRQLNDERHFDSSEQWQPDQRVYVQFSCNLSVTALSISVKLTTEEYEYSGCR